ncbi:PH domain-containing protein [Corticicoccus populi]|uniref:PH domain-containing protein n=1 Tax=Corticicoccus populi TaxID=1812821 RepID=A0ABW5WYH3_9STAP
MRNKITDLSDVALFENEVTGTELAGTIEFEINEQHIFEGALVPTTRRLFVNVYDRYGNVLKQSIRLEDITDIRQSRQILLGNILHIWVGNEVLITMHGIPQIKLEKFVRFLRKYRAKAMHIEDYGTVV